MHSERPSEASVVLEMVRMNQASVEVLVDHYLGRGGWKVKVKAKNL